MQDHVSYARFRRGVGFKLFNQLLSAGAIASTWIIIVNAMGGSFGLLLDNLMQSLAAIVPH